MPVSRRLAAVIIAIGVLHVVHACVYYNEDDKCGPNMVYSAEAHICLCDARSIKVVGGCQRCPSSREPATDKCVCPSGTKEKDDGTCAAIAGLGDACDATHTCDDAVYNYCAMKADGSSGVCTKHCSHDADCDETYTCADWEDSPYCRQFTGVGVTCAMGGLGDPACTGDADYCFMGQCFVRQCKPTTDHATDDCPKDRKCCDVSFLKMPDVMTACVALESMVCK